MSILADAEFRRQMRTPLIVFVVLMLLLACVSAIGAVVPHGRWWIVELACAALMVGLVIVFSMEMFRHQPIVRLFSLLGFFWVAILFGLTMNDYLTR